MGNSSYWTPLQFDSIPPEAPTECPFCPFKMRLTVDFRPFLCRVLPPYRAVPRRIPSLAWPGPVESRRVKSAGRLDRVWRHHGSGGGGGSALAAGPSRPLPAESLTAPPCSVSAGRSVRTSDSDGGRGRGQAGSDFRPRPWHGSGRLGAGGRSQNQLIWLLLGDRLQ